MFYCFKCLIFTEIQIYISLITLKTISKYQRLSILSCCKLGIYYIHHAVEEVSNAATFGRTTAFYSVSCILVFLRVEFQTKREWRPF